MNIFIAFVVGLITLVFCQPSYANSEIIYSSFKYAMGDNDSKNDAKRIAFVEAKRLLIEKVGVFVESSTTVIDSTLSKDQIRTYSSAIVGVVVDKEEFVIKDGVQSISVTLKASVDTDDMIVHLKKIRADKGLQKKIIEQQKQLTDMQQRLDKIHYQLVNAKDEKAYELRNKRTKILRNISELNKIASEIESLSNKAIINIKNGMTFDEVIRVAGKPRLYGTNYMAYGADKRGCYNYGKLWVITCGELVCGYVNPHDYTDCLSSVIDSKLIKFDSSIP